MFPSPENEVTARVDKEGKSAATRDLKVGAAAAPVVGPAQTVLADCVANENVNAGVVVGVATEVVAMVPIFPALKLVTVPVPAGKSAATNARKVGVAAPPEVGPAKTVLAVCVAKVAVTTPVEPLLLRTTPSPEKEVTPPAPPEEAIVTPPAPSAVKVMFAPALRLSRFCNVLFTLLVCKVTPRPPLPKALSIIIMSSAITSSMPIKLRPRKVVIVCCG